MANFDAISYQKGQAVLKQLSAYVGEEAFLAGLQAYFRDHAWGNTRLEDLTGAVGEAAGEDLSAWERRLARPRRHRHPLARGRHPDGHRARRRALRVRTASTSAATPRTVTAGSGTSPTSPSAPTAPRPR